MMHADLLRIKYFIYTLLHRGGYEHAAYLKKHHAFHAMGEQCFFQPYKLPADCAYVRLGNNVVVASGVVFICHDVIHRMLNAANNTAEDKVYTTFYGKIDIKDNVFIGSNTTILANVTVGSNVIIGAGSLVNKDVPDGKIVAGVPARVIGDTRNLAEARREYSDSPLGRIIDRNERLKYFWGEKEG